MVAKSCRRAAVLFAGDLEAGPLSAQLQGFTELVNRSSFQMALEATWPGKQLETPWVGGYYVPDVRVDRGSDCDPFRIAMIYSALPAPQAYEDSAQEYKRIMQMFSECAYAKNIVSLSWAHGVAMVRSDQARQCE